MEAYCYENISMSKVSNGSEFSTTCVLPDVKVPDTFSNTDTFCLGYMNCICCHYETILLPVELQKMLSGKLSDNLFHFALM